VASEAPARGVPPLAIFAAAAALVLGTLFICGVTVDEAARFASFELAFALLPGLALFLALSSAKRPLADALALAWPLGLAAEIGCFVLTAAVGERWLFDLYPPVVIALAAPLAWRRRANLGWPRRAVTAPVASVVLLVTVAASVLVGLFLFAPAPLPRDNPNLSYFPDLIFNISLAAEIVHHWPFMSPSVAGQALHYHIFTNIDQAAIAQVTHVELSTIVLRLQPTALIALAGVQLFALGRRVGGSRAAGLLTLALGMFSGELNFARIAVFGGDSAVLGGLYSPSYEIGVVFFLAILLVLIEGRERAPARFWGHWLTLALLSLGATGAKSTVLPVLAGGLALIALARMFERRRVRPRDLRQLAIVLAAFAIGYLLIYRGGGQGIQLKPLDFVRYSLFSGVYGHGPGSLPHALALVGVGLVTLCGLLLPVAGALFVARRWWWRSGVESAEGLLMATFAASIVPFVLVAVPGDSEGYFVVYGFLAGIVVSAEGLVTLAAHLRARAAELWRPLAAGMAGAAAAAALLWQYRSKHAVVPAYLLLACGVAAAVWLARGPGRRLAAGQLRRFATLATTVAIGLTMLAEPYQLSAATITSWANGDQPQAVPPTSPPDLTADLWQGLVWIRDHYKPSVVLAVNNHYLTRSLTSRYYYYSAFSERNVVIESWDYTPQGFANLAVHQSVPPFSQLRALNDGATIDGSPAAIDTLRDRYGVSLLVVDRVHGSGPYLLPPSVARITYANSEMTVFLIDPAPRKRR
jgi:hypothetical protein